MRCGEAMLQWRRGLLRLWIVCSVVWTVGVLVALQPWSVFQNWWTSRWMVDNISASPASTANARALTLWTDNLAKYEPQAAFAALALAMPLIALLIAMAAVWIGKGFARQPTG